MHPKSVLFKDITFVKHNRYATTPFAYSATCEIFDTSEIIISSFLKHVYKAVNLRIIKKMYS